MNRSIHGSVSLGMKTFKFGQKPICIRNIHAMTSWEDDFIGLATRTCCVVGKIERLFSLHVFRSCNFRQWTHSFTHFKKYTKLMLAKEV